MIQTWHLPLKKAINEKQSLVGVNFKGMSQLPLSLSLLFEKFENIHFLRLHVPFPIFIFHPKAFKAKATCLINFSEFSPPVGRRSLFQEALIPPSRLVSFERWNKITNCNVARFPGDGNNLKKWKFFFPLFRKAKND